MNPETFVYKGFDVEIVCKEFYMYYFVVFKNGKVFFQDKKHAYCGYNNTVGVAKKFIDERLNNVEIR